MTTIIVKDTEPRGLTRTKTDRVLEDAGWGSSFKSEEDKDKCRFLERKFKAAHNADDSRIIAKHINRVK